MTSPARAGNTLLAAKPTAVARNALAKRVRPSGSRRNCHRNARIARLTIIVESDSASHAGRAAAIAVPTRRRSTLWKNNAISAIAAASTMRVRTRERIKLERPYYTYTAALDSRSLGAARQGQPPYVVVVRLPVTL